MVRLTRIKPMKCNITLRHMKALNDGRAESDNTFLSILEKHLCALALSTRLLCI